VRARLLQTQLGGVVLTTDQEFGLRIEITGAIGSGKTTLANALAARFQWAIATEIPEQVPFWTDVYSEGVYQFEKDLHFLLVHGVIIRERQAQARQPLVCDFSFVQDMVYARLGQGADELAAYYSVFQHTVRQCAPADLIIHLSCPTDVLLQRIALRGRPPEQTITSSFLNNLSDALEASVSAITSTPVMVVDSHALNFAIDPLPVASMVAGRLRLSA